MDPHSFVLLIQLVTGYGYSLEMDSLEHCNKVLRAEKQKQERAGFIVAASGCFPRQLIIHAAKEKR